MVKKWFQQYSSWSSTPSKTVGGAALLIAVAGIASRILGFFRDRLLASHFGAGDVLDAYYAAFRIPDLLYGFLVMGALSAAFVPVFTELVSKQKKREAWELTSGLLFLTLSALGLLAALGLIFTPQLMEVMAPGFVGEKRYLAALMTRIMLISPFFLTVSAVLSGVLLSFKQFAAYSFAPVFYNIGIIIGIVFLAPHLGEAGLAWGVVLGSILHMLVQVPAVMHSGFKCKGPFLLAWKNRGVRQVFWLMIPRSLGVGVNQISLVVMTIFASTLVSGSLSAFTLANNIQSVPLGLFGIAFSLAAFPTLSLLAAKKERKAFFKEINVNTQKILFFVVPLSIFMIIFRAQFVRVMFGAGHFDWQDTILTFEVLKLLAVSLFAQSLIPLFARAFFALQNTKTPLYIALVSEAVHISLIPFLLPHFAVQALAIAFSVGTFVNFGLLYLYLRRTLPEWDDTEVIGPAVRIFIASFIAGLVAQISKFFFALTANPLDTFIEVFLQLVIGLSIGGSIYVLSCHWLKVPQLDMLKRFFVRNLLRQPEKVALTEDHPERGEW